MSDEAKDGKVVKLRFRTTDSVITATLALCDGDDQALLVSTLDLELARTHPGLFDHWKGALSDWLKSVYVSAGVPVTEMVEINPHEVAS